MSNRSIILFLGAMLVFLATHASGQTPTPAETTRSKVITGEFSLETAVKQRDPYLVSEDATIAYVNELKAKLNGLAGGSGAPPGRPDEKVISFLTGIYLYCTVRDSTCPAVLDTILEIDVTNARISKQEECPTIRHFWQIYLQNDLENRHRHLTQLSQMSAVSEFNTKNRPGYIRCKDTITKVIKSDKSDAEYFKTRYSDGKILAAVDFTLKLLESLKVKSINVFKELDAKVAAVNARGG